MKNKTKRGISKELSIFSIKGGSMRKVTLGSPGISNRSAHPGSQESAKKGRKSK